jgi:hypothetical protein
MSISAIKHVRSHPKFATLCGTDRHILLELAWRYNDDDGGCWPSLATISADTAWTRRQVINAIARLQSAGILGVEKRFRKGGLHGSNWYTFRGLVQTVNFNNVNSGEYSSPLVVNTVHHNGEPRSPHGKNMRKEIMKEKEKKPRTKSAADPRSAHPAILAVKSITGRNPNRGQYDELIETLGTTPDCDRLRHNFREWCKRGYNPTATTWAVDWYADPSQIPGKRKSAYQPDWNAGGTGKLVL